jgi:hypothetical protein
MFALEERVRWVRENAEYIASAGATSGFIIENMVAAQPGRQYVDGKGVDYLCEQYQRVEVKSTVKKQGSVLRVQHYQGKRGRFDHLHLVDGITGREFMIPHDDFFNHVGNREEFKWSVSYNKNDRAQRDNTNFILKYEVNI